MSANSVSRRVFMAAAAAAPAVPALAAADTSDRIRIFDPPPTRIRILCTRVGPSAGFTPAELEQLKAAGKNNVEIFMPTTQEELNTLLPECDVVFGQLNAATLAKAKNLKWVQNLEAGLEREMFPELVAHPCVMTNMARMYAPALGETAMAILLSLTRGIQAHYVTLYEKKEWKPVRNLVEIQGKTMGIVALGGLGQATAKIAHYGFDMKILAVDIKPMAKPVFVDTLREPEWLMEMVPQVDVLVCCCPNTPVSRGMISDAVFRAMKKTAYFINISRGPLMDENALASALKEGRIAGAGSDPGPVEPYPPTGVLWGCPNMIFTQHTGGFSPERQIRHMGLLADNVRRYAHGLPLENVVDKVRGY
ncbi:MAG: D-2-hydroxyacid dehydrogenase [Bryobacteraceae bacterium]|jgi:phosphoglycerate dehydrogenase-like enzyme